jgi:hypothetical protein
MRHVGGTADAPSHDMIPGGMLFREPEKILTVMEHLEEAVKQCWLAMLNHDMPNLHLHAVT